LRRLTQSRGSSHWQRGPPRGARGAGPVYGCNRFRPSTPIEEGDVVGASRGLRQWAANTLQWDPARNTAKRGVYLIARARGGWLRRSGKLPAVANIFTAMSPKAGSQWPKALFGHQLVRARTGLLTLPQLEFEFGSETSSFPAGTVVPGIYASYPDYRAIPKPHPYRTVYIFRDPRDIVVSGYFSAIGTHRKMNYRKADDLEGMRAAMRSMSRDLALRYAVETLAERLREMATWVGVDDENVALFRLEDIENNPSDEVGRMLRHCGVHLGDDELAQVVADTSRAALQRRDLAGRPPGSDSHYRVNRQAHDEVLKAEHLRAIEEVVPGLIERLGYPDEYGAPEPR
jgi:Sulfotransferase domain